MEDIHDFFFAMSKIMRNFAARTRMISDMKKMMKNILGVCLLMGVMNVVSCSKYEGADISQKTPGTLVATSWVYEINDSITIQDEEEEMQVDLKTSHYIMFQTATVGMTMTEVTSSMAPNLNTIDVSEFKYSYQNPKGSLTHATTDDFGHETTEKVPFTVNGTKIVVDWPKEGTVTYNRR